MTYILKLHPLHEDDLNPLMSAFSTIDSGYIGNETTAKFLKKKGIAPQLASPYHKVCSIGFCEKKQKWFGWSHRALYGFGIGSKVSKGDCAYVPTDWDDFLQDAARFWTCEYKSDVKAERGKDEGGLDVAKVTWNHTDTVPNERFRGTTDGADMYPPKVWGRGEWTAKTMADAKQMAIDFAEGVS